MKKILAFSGSPRLRSNSDLLLDSFINGAKTSDSFIIRYDKNNLNIKPCTGCLRCNIVKKCTIRNDDWDLVSDEIYTSDVLVFAAPIYFQHLPGQMKILIDRFRSFVHVAITETGLIHTPHYKWKKEIVLLLSMGSSDKSEANAVIDMFKFISKIMGDTNLHVLTATRLGISGQISKSHEELEKLYKKINLNTKLASLDHKVNKKWLDESYELGIKLSS